MLPKSRDSTEKTAKMRNHQHVAQNGAIFFWLVKGTPKSQNTKLQAFAIPTACRGYFLDNSALLCAILKIDVFHEKSTFFTKINIFHDFPKNVDFQNRAEKRQIVQKIPTTRRWNRKSL